MPPSPTAEPLRILVVEDNPADVSLLREALAEAHVRFELETLADGALAVEYVRVRGGAAPVPDVIVLDLNLPRRSGLEVLREIRRCAGLASVPVAVLTSSNALHDRRGAEALGADLFLRKPASFDEFARVGSAIRGLCART